MKIVNPLKRQNSSSSFFQSGIEGNLFFMVGPDSFQIQILTGHHWG
jgi:hypothetical protein